MTRIISKRQQLRQLVVDHPDWTYGQYAKHLDQDVASVRGALSSMGLSRHKKPPKEDLKRKSKAKPQQSYTIASKCGPTRSGYLKLM